MPTKKRIKSYEEMADSLLERLSTDPKFEELFDRDPAAALKEQFPDEFGRVPKKTINAILVGHDSAVSTELAGTRGNAEAAAAEALAGALVKAAKALYKAGTKLTKTEKIRSGAKSAALFVGGEVAARYLNKLADNFPDEPQTPKVE